MLNALKWQILTIAKNQMAYYYDLSIKAWQGIIISFVEATLVGICYFLSLYFVNELHLDIAYAGMIMTFYGLGTMLGGLLGGKLSDHISAVWISIFALLIQAAAYFSLAYIQSIYLLIIDLFVIGIGSYGFITSNYAWVLKYCPHNEQQRLKAINILNIASNLGLGAAAIFIGFCTTHIFTFIFFIASLLLCVTALYLVYQNTPITSETFFTIPVIDTCAEDTTKKNDNILWVVLGCLFLMGMIISQTNSTYPIYLQRAFPKLGTQSFSILFIINTLIVVFLQTPLMNIFCNHNKVILASVGAFLMGAGMVLLCFSKIFISAIISCIILTIGEILFFSASQLICYEKSNAHKKGYSLGIYRMVYAGSRIVGPVAGGIIYQKFGGNMVWYMCFVFGLICCIPAIYFGKQTSPSLISLES